MLCRRSVVESSAIAILLLAASASGMQSSLAIGGDSRLPSLQDLRKAVLEYFQALPDCQPGCILTRNDAEPMFERLRQMGWAVADRKAILAAMPSPDEFLVKQLRTPQGRKFAVQIAAYPQGYDRLDRLSRLPNGKTTVRDLVRAKGGQDLVKYMTTTHGGAELGKMLSQDPHGDRFNQRTGRIYTLDALLIRLEQSYAAATGTAPQPSTNSETGR